MKIKLLILIIIITLLVVIAINKQTPTALKLKDHWGYPSDNSIYNPSSIKLTKFEMTG
jgi:hypothetical protein